MKLIIAIIQDKYVNDVIKSFLDHNIRITKLASTGGFLKDGNTTFIIGVNPDELDLAKSIVADIIDEDPMVSEDSEGVIVHGAHLFIVDVNDFMTI